MGRYTEAKNKARELYDLVPYITTRIAFNYLQKLDLPKENIPKAHSTIHEWFKEFGKVSNKDRYDKLMSLWLKDNAIVVSDKKVSHYKKEK